jgi:hypothetical protein
MSVSAWHPHCFAVLDMNRNTGSVKDRSKTQTPALPLYEVVYADNSPPPGSSIAASGRATTEPLVNPAFGPMTKWLGTSKSESCRGASRLTRDVAISLWWPVTKAFFWSVPTSTEQRPRRWWSACKDTGLITQGSWKACATSATVGRDKNT